MTLDDRFADLRCAIDAETVRARSEALADFLRCAARVRGAASDGERASAMEDARRMFAEEALAFLESLAGAPAADPGSENHLRARRFARVRVAEIQLYHAEAMKRGRSAGDVYTALKAQMDAARAAYREAFITPVSGTADYLHSEFVRTLANDDAAMLGPGYPGPLV